MFDCKIKIAKDFFSNLFFGNSFDMSYIVEAVDWSIAWDGKQITRALNSQKLLKSRIASCPWGLRGQIVHYGSVNVLRSFGLPSKKVKPILTWFHFVFGDKNNEKIRTVQERFNFIHTSCQKTKENLINFGIDQKKIKVIPLGVDTDIFKPASLETKEQLKKSLGLPEDRFIVGSFQKDGSGWGLGDEPKLIKGPDILVKSLSILAKNFPIFVLLAGPSRGYVKKNLEKNRIPFMELGNLGLYDIARIYQALDLYIVSSRIEGGPKAVLESMASGIPLISTDMGMISDMRGMMKELLVAPIEDSQGLADLAGNVLSDKNFAWGLSQEQREVALNFSWDNIAKKYYNQMYSKLF